MERKYKTIIRVRITPEVFAESMRQSNNYVTVVDYGVPEDYEYLCWSWDPERRCFNFFFQKKETETDTTIYDDWDELVPEFRTVSLDTNPEQPEVDIVDQWNREWDLEHRAKNQIEVDDIDGFLDQFFAAVRKPD